MIIRKNLFGFVVGKEKFKLHLKAGHNIEYFADILIDIYETVAPDLNIIDGIWGMEGNGPTSGTPENFGIFEMGKNGYYLEAGIDLKQFIKTSGFITSPGPPP